MARKRKFRGKRSCIFTKLLSLLLSRYLNLDTWESSQVYNRRPSISDTAGISPLIQAVSLSLTRLGSCIFCTWVDQILGVIPQSYGSTLHCSVGSGVEGPSHHDWVRRMPSHPDLIYRLTHAWEAVKGHFLTLCSLDFLHRLVSCQECADNSEMLISGTICMKRSPNGFVPARGFLESGMAPRPSFNDSSNPKDIVVIDDDGTEVSHRSLRTPISTYQKHVRYAVFEFQELLDSSSISSGSYISE